MFDAVRNNKKIVQIFLCLIALPFAFWGFDSLKNAGSNEIATVGEIKISVYEFDQALREQSDRARRVLGDQFDPSIMDSTQVRKEVLNSLIDRRLLALEIYHSKLMTTHDALVAAVKNNPLVQENGKISEDKYRQMLSAYGMSEAQYEEMLRQELTMGQLVSTINDSTFVSNTQLEALLQMQTEEREYSQFKVAADSFADKVTIETSAMQKYYDENKAQFEVPRQIKAEYLVFTPESLAEQIEISEEDIKAWYDSHKNRYDSSERRASHILIQTGNDKEKARKEAQAILDQLRQDPEKFGELARMHSQDPGSAAKDGDLGFFARGTMVPAFEDAVFGMKEGEISGLVESDFGFHIIKLTGIKDNILSLEEVRPQIAVQLKQQEAQRKFAEEAEVFRDSISQEFDSLEPTADKFKLKVQKTDWLPRKLSMQQIAELGPVANDKVLNALFSPDAIEKKQNIDAIQTNTNMLIAPRVVNYRPEEIKSFDQVKPEIEKTLRIKALAALAQQSGEEILAKLKAGEDTLEWSEAQSVSRISGRALPAEVLHALFRANVEKLPAYTAVSQENGDYVLFKLAKLGMPDSISEADRQAFRDQYVSILSQEDWDAYLLSLRSKYKIEINEQMLEKKTQYDDGF